MCKKLKKNKISRTENGVMKKKTQKLKEGFAIQILRAKCPGKSEHYFC